MSQDGGSIIISNVPLSPSTNADSDERSSSSIAGDAQHQQAMAAVLSDQNQFFGDYYSGAGADDDFPGFPLGDDLGFSSLEGMMDWSGGGVGGEGAASEV